jgi:class 3 adenylate cyclase
MRVHSQLDKNKLSDEFSQVSILFTDIAGFTAYCDAHTTK